MTMSGISAKWDATSGHVERPDMIGKLETVRGELDRCLSRMAWTRILLVEVALASTLALADDLWILPTPARAAGLVGMAALAVSMFFRRQRPADRSAIAAEVEAHFPDLGQRVRTVAEYAEPSEGTVPASPGLVRALVRETDRRASSLVFDTLVPWASFRRGALALILAMAGVVLALVFSDELRTAALRLVLLPRHYTTIDVKPGDTTVKAGEDFRLDVNLAGRPVESASWSYHKKGEGDRWTTLPMGGADHHGLIGELASQMKDCQADFDYRVRAGEVESPTFHVRVVHPLVLKTIEATVTPPAYTRRPEATIKQGNFRAIEGSRVRLAVTLDRPPSTATLTLGASDDPSHSTIPLKIEGARLTAELPTIAKETPYEIAAADGDGMKLELTTYRIRFQADEKPTLRFIRPDETLGVTPTTEVPIQVEASDDFGVAQVGIRYKVGDGPEETLHLADLKDQPVTATALATLYLEKHPLRFPDAVTYYAIAEDAYPGGPHRTVSELRYIDILPYRQEYELTEGGSGGPPCSGASVTLEELIARQRVNLNRTFAAEAEPKISDPEAGRLARYERELADATGEFASGLSAIAGPVASLEEATASMRSAIEALTAKEIKTARPREEAALRGLIAARQNLRKLLKPSQSPCSGACRSFDAKQAQRIRRPPSDPSSRQLAQLENDIRQLAERQQKFSEEIEPKGTGGPQLDPPQGAPKPSTSKKKPSSSASKPPAKPGSSTGRSGSRQDPAQEQKQAAEEAERLRQLSGRDEALTEMTRRRMAEAAEAVKQSSRSAEAGREEKAAAEAREAARKLGSVARQVGALKAGELADRLARQREIARAIAAAERELGRKVGGSNENGSETGQKLADRQRELADEVAALADVLDRLKSTAVEEQSELAQEIGRASSSNPPAEVEDSMRQNAEAIGQGRIGEAAKAADQAAARLEALALDLESARRAAIQPQLERLLAAEKQAAEVQERLRSARQSSDQAEAEKALADLSARLDKLGTGGGSSIGQAADRLSEATRSGAGWTHSPDVPEGRPGFYVPPVIYTEAVQAVSLALQAQIQALMLENVLVDRDGPVPPQYRQLVEDYYRILSQDLR